MIRIENRHKSVTDTVPSTPCVVHSSNRDNLSLRQKRFYQGQGTGGHQSTCRDKITT